MQVNTVTEETAAAVASARGCRGARRRDHRRSGAAVARRGARCHRQGRRPPARREVDRAALDLIARRGTEILATARRYAAGPEDAEDAYQRGLEILLTKAPSTSEDDLVPWLKTVVKHEAFALRRQRERHSPITDDGELGERGTSATLTHDQAERYEDLRQGAEALRQLKPQEIRALQLRAEGYSYKEICAITGWTYTNINRNIGPFPCESSAISGFPRRRAARGRHSSVLRGSGMRSASGPRRMTPRSSSSWRTSTRRAGSSAPSCFAASG
jgi:RNA polymerase sigma factor (sigma-70 family)